MLLVLFIVMDDAAPEVNWRYNISSETRLKCLKECRDCCLLLYSWFSTLTSSKSPPCCNSHLLTHITCSTSFRLLCVPGHYLMDIAFVRPYEGFQVLCLWHETEKISGPHHLSVVGNIERETKYSCVEMDHTRSGDASSGCRGRAQLTWQYPEGVFSGRSCHPLERYVLKSD